MTGHIEYFSESNGSRSGCRFDLELCFLFNIKPYPPQTRKIYIPYVQSGGTDQHHQLSSGCSSCRQWLQFALPPRNIRHHLSALLEPSPFTIATNLLFLPETSVITSVRCLSRHLLEGLLTSRGGGSVKHTLMWGFGKTRTSSTTSFAAEGQQHHDMDHA